MARWRIVVPILLAVCIALGGGYLASRWVHSQVAGGPAVADKDTQTQSVAVAILDLPWGTKLKSEQLAVKPFLKDTLPPGAFSDPSALEGRVLIYPVKGNEPILESRLAPASVETGGVSAIVKPGKRALAVKGDKVIGLSGFVRPGNRVDVFVTLKDPRTDKDVTKLVLQDILVLATGEEVQKNESGDEVSPVDVYTLEVTPDEGEKLSLASTKGRLQLALRNATDVETVLTKGATIQQTLDSYKEIRRPKRTKRGERPPTMQVQIIKGNEVSGKTFYQ